MADIKNPYSPSPIYGLKPGFSIADLPIGYSDGVVALDKVTAATTSATQSLGLRTLEIDVTCANAGQTCDVLILKASDSSTLYKWTGVKHGAHLFAGNYEGFNLDGADFKVRVENLSGAAATTVSVKRTS